MEAYYAGDKVEKIDEGKAYTKGNSFRAIAEALARKYRAEKLRLKDYDAYGHRLTTEDGNRGENFLPSLRGDILRAVKERQAIRKGIDFARTSKNMLSSQAMCFNLFVPLNRDKQLAARLFHFLIGGIRSIDDDIAYEYTPCKCIFGDQSGKGGVDCDVLVRYVGKNGGKGLVVIETKYVETKFSTCGFRKYGQKDPCPVNTVVKDDYSNCRYHYKKNYSYWRVAGESSLYQMERLHSQPCPFGGSLWQLWTNLSLAYALAKENQYSEFKYVVICPRSNTILSQDNEVFDGFKSILRRPEVFKVIYLEDIGEALRDESVVQKRDPWIDEFISRYCWHGQEKSV